MHVTQLSITLYSTQRAQLIEVFVRNYYNDRYLNYQPTIWNARGSSLIIRIWIIGTNSKRKKMFQLLYLFCWNRLSTKHNCRVKKWSLSIAKTIHKFLKYCMSFVLWHLVPQFKYECIIAQFRVRRQLVTLQCNFDRY